MKYDYKDFLDYEYCLTDFMEFVAENIYITKTDEIEDLNYYLDTMEDAYKVNVEHIYNDNLDRVLDTTLTKKDFVYIDFLIYRNKQANNGVLNDFEDDLKEFFSIYNK